MAFFWMFYRYNTCRSEFSLEQEKSEGFRYINADFDFHAMQTLKKGDFQLCLYIMRLSAQVNEEGPMMFEYKEKDIILSETKKPETSQDESTQGVASLNDDLAVEGFSEGSNNNSLA
jgi:hypothetical protein